MRPLDDSSPGALPRAEWIAAFIQSMLQVSADDTAKIRAVAEASWESAGHRAPVDAVQDILIERYLDAKENYDKGLKPPQ